METNQNQIKKQTIQNIKPIETRVKELYELGKISDINTLRQKLKSYKNDKEAWNKVNTLDAGPTPAMIAQSNNYRGPSALLDNYNRSNDKFFQAIMFGDKSEIGNILKNNPKKINTAIVIDNSSCHCLPISWAITLEDEELVKYLLKKGANIDIKSSIGLSPFDEAYHLPKIRKLMKSYYTGSKLQIQEDFSKAIHEDNIEKIKEIVSRSENSKFDIIKETISTKTPLEIAVSHTSIDATQYLIGKGAFENIPELNCYKRKLFLSACTSKAIPIIQLLAKEADIKFYLIERFNKHCPFNYYLSDEVKEELFSLYKAHCKTTDQELLSLATKLGHKDLIKQILNKNININEYDSEKMTALLWASSYGNADIMSFLIQHGADVNAIDKKERCCLRKLIRMHKTSPKKDGRQLTTSELLPCLFLLMCYGADENIKDNERQSTIDWVKKQKFNDNERKLINRVLNACQLSYNDLECLLNDIYDFQLKELELVKEKKDKQTIYYIEKALVKNNLIDWLPSSLKKDYENCMIYNEINNEIKSENSGISVITLTSPEFEENVEKVIWAIGKQNEKNRNQLKIINDKFEDETTNQYLYIDKVIKKVIYELSNSESLIKSYEHKITPYAHLIVWKLTNSNKKATQ
jgi:ankyrin repeat protein